MSAMGLYSEHRNHPWVKHLRNALIALLLTFLAALALFPIFYMITSSFGPAIATAGNMRSDFPLQLVVGFLPGVFQLQRVRQTLDPQQLHHFPQYGDRQRDFCLHGGLCLCQDPF